MMAAILNSDLEFGHLVFCHLNIFFQTHSHLPRLVPTICTKNHFTHSFWLNLMMAAILNSVMLDSDTAILDSDNLVIFSPIHSKTDSHLPLWLWLKLIAHLTFKLIHSDSTWWWQPSWILPCWIQSLSSWIQTPCYLLSESDSHLPMTLIPTILTKHFTHSFWLNLMMAAILNSAILNLAMLDAAILEFPLKVTHTCQDCFSQFAQNISHIHSDSTWWWQPSWILPCWFQSLPSWIQTPCYLLSDSLQYTLPPLWLWLKLIQSDSNSFILN